MTKVILIASAVVLGIVLISAISSVSVKASNKNKRSSPLPEFEIPENGLDYSNGDNANNGKKNSTQGRGGNGNEPDPNEIEWEFSLDFDNN